MRYVMRQKLFCLGDDFQIKDESGRDAFVVDGKAFSLAKQLSFQDLAGNTLMSINQKLLSWGPTYELAQGDNVIGVVKKELFNIFSYRFAIELSGGLALQATGEFTDHEYVITRDGAPVATISKQWFTVSDTYGVEVGAGENDVLMLAITVVVDMVCHPDHK
jgi:uncharacterized protein YxjI